MGPDMERLHASMLGVSTLMSADLVEHYVNQVLPRITTTFDHIPPARGDELLVDIGCYGPVLGPLHDVLGYRHMGAVAKDDWAACDSKILPAWAKHRGIDLTLWFGDIERETLPWNDGEADVVLMLEILEHFAIDPMFALNEANRILKNEGKLILSTPNAASDNALMRLLAGLHPHDGIGYNGADTNRHNRLYNADELYELLSIAGFTGIEVISLDESDYRPRLGMRVELGYALARLIRAGRRKKFAGSILLVTAFKSSAPKERYPRPFYIDRELFADFFNTVEKRRATSE